MVICSCLVVLGCFLVFVGLIAYWLVCLSVSNTPAQQYATRAAVALFIIGVRCRCNFESLLYTLQTEWLCSFLAQIQ